MMRLSNYRPQRNVVRALICRRYFLKTLLLVAFTSFVTTVMFHFFHNSNYILYELRSAIDVPPASRQQQTEVDPWEKIDWHDEEFMRLEKQRNGIGEHGEAATLPPEHDKRMYDALFRCNGYNGLLSDYISLNRSVPDFRPKGCRTMKYRRELPEASIIIPMHNEHWSMLLRTVYGIINRSPAKLIREIIIVDDGSTKPQLKEQLDIYIATHLPKVRVLRLDAPRKGLMMARSTGAQNASAPVLIFMDSHIEVCHNWLPPLLEPIAENDTTCVCPVFDAIHHETFGIRSQYEIGGRGTFDWELAYGTLPLLPEDEKNPTKPFRSPVMLGAAFAISKRFFWELGGYDSRLQIWGGEQYELSFKVWQCGGTMVDAPCSRVAHLYRGGPYAAFADPKIGDFVGRNYKRVAEIWMDEFAEYLYKRKPHYRSLDVGDLSEQRGIREKLTCKPFKWFLDEVAFDLVKKHPLIDPPDYGSGKIKPLINNHLCLTAIDETSVELKDCSSVNNAQQYRQDFNLRWSKDIHIKGTKNCLDLSDHRSKAAVGIYHCHGGLGNQLWKYNTETQQFEFGFTPVNKLCLECDVGRKKVYVETCDRTSKAQKWKVDSLNEDALKKWDETIPIV